MHDSAYAVIKKCLIAVMVLHFINFISSNALYLIFINVPTGLPQRYTLRISGLASFGTDACIFIVI
jgi:hypothetical protein